MPEARDGANEEKTNAQAQARGMILENCTAEEEKRTAAESFRVRFDRTGRARI
jgi:hypothetical protein